MKLKKRSLQSCVAPKAVKISTLSTATKRQVDAEFESVMWSIHRMSETELKKMHSVLLKYCKGQPLPRHLSPQRYIKKLAKKPIRGGRVFGCKTYGQALRLNIAIVKILDDIYLKD